MSAFLSLRFAPADDDPPHSPTRRLVRREVHDADDAVNTDNTETEYSYERSLLERIRTGDHPAFETLVERYYAKLVGFAESIVCERSAAEDIVQDTLVALWHNRATLNVRTTVAGYLFGSVRHGALNWQRHQRTRERWLGQLPPAAAVPSLDTRLEIDEQERLLQTAIDALDLPYRQVLVLRSSGLTYDAIANVLAIPVKTAKTRGLRGIAKLRAALDGIL